MATTRQPTNDQAPPHCYRYTLRYQTPHAHDYVMIVIYTFNIAIIIPTLTQDGLLCTSILYVRVIFTGWQKRQELIVRTNDMWKKVNKKIKHAQAKRYKLSGGSVWVVRAELTSLLTTVNLLRYLPCLRKVCACCEILSLVYSTFLMLRKFMHDDDDNNYTHSRLKKLQFFYSQQRTV